ncbi:hypothetical protein NL676_002528 [Syzygium grande]|nr:hypothetical protein NL676_002528 [Syzygium grande]
MTSPASPAVVIPAIGFNAVHIPVSAEALISVLTAQIISQLVPIRIILAIDFTCGYTSKPTYSTVALPTTTTGGGAHPMGIIA